MTARHDLRPPLTQTVSPPQGTRSFPSLSPSCPRLSHSPQSAPQSRPPLPSPRPPTPPSSSPRSSVPLLRPPLAASQVYAGASRLVERGRGRRVFGSAGLSACRLSGARFGSRLWRRMVKVKSRRRKVTGEKEDGGRGPIVRGRREGLGRSVHLRSGDFVHPARSGAEK